MIKLGRLNKLTLQVFLQYLLLLQLIFLSWKLAVNEYMFLCALMCLPISILGHFALLAWHEAAHGNLTLFSGKNRKGLTNEMLGYAISALVIFPNSVHRLLHATHHQKLGQLGDLEQWPFTDPKVPLRWRQFALLSELLCAPIFAAVVIFRGLFFAFPKAESWQKIRISLDMMLSTMCWIFALSWISLEDQWTPFILAYAIPAWLSATLFLFRNNAEHMGLIASKTNIEELTREIHPTSRIERFLCWVWLDECHHSAHHRKSRLAGKELVDEAANTKKLIYSSYCFAFWDAMKSALNPRFGCEWQ